ncbi:carboxypeptidase regulatory-like domain-containing protein [Terriglobus sp.]|uniref:TonB-dependent receptor n=1 Tax=Terriglobus sp. TaxID=1889013 RepID=UPI003B00234F
MRQFVLAVSLATAAVTAPAAFYGQAVSVNGGSIQGTITDPSGAIVPNAEIELRSVDQGTTRTLHTDGAGYYVIGPLNPGDYKLLITAPGFQRTEVTTRILTGTATPGNFKLTVGQSTETVEVSTGAVQVNTDQPGVSDVITREQIAALPVNGRNFLDLAQIEPGVQLQNGTVFDPTKAGYTGISVNGVSGRTTRIILDGSDITDEYVGTTIVVASQGSVNEFQLNRSTQDVSGEVTSQGQVLVSTRSGTNTLHGQGFYNFQDQRALYANPNSTPNAAGVKVPPIFQRNQYGVSIGGPVIKDKLFFFTNGERTQQASGAPNNLGSLFSNTAFSQANPTVNAPYKATYSVGRLDYTGPFGGHYFARGLYTYDSTITGTNYSVYANRDNTYGLAFGADFSSGRLTHSFRGGYEKFHNLIGDATQNGVYNPLGNVAVRFTAQNLAFGPNVNAPQATYQSDKQLRYDGSYTRGAHNIRFGGSMNRVLGGGAAAFYRLAPRITESAASLLGGVVTANNPQALGCGGVVGAAACPSDPINGYNSTGGITFSNGFGGATEQPGFDQPVGGIRSWRAAGYVTDGWKVTPNFTFVAGLRWSMDTNRQNNDLNPVTCGDLFANVAYVCNGLSSTTAISSLFSPELTGRVRQNYGNFSPQIGINYAPGNHKTVFRAGVGIFYESAVFNNLTNARGPLVRQAFGYSTVANACSAFSVTYADGTVSNASPDGTRLQTLCQNQTIGQAAKQFAALSKAYQSNASNNPALNASYAGARVNLSGTFGQQYKQPYSEQWNFGIQRELFPGAVISADYIHNAALKIGQTTDLNRLGAARTFNQANAVSAINRVPGIIVVVGGVNTTPYATCANSNPQAVVACAISRGASITTFSGVGLDSGANYTSGNNYTYAGRTTPAAFPGLNPNLGSGSFIRPTGRSGYDALQVVYRQSKRNPIKFVDSGNVQISYNLSRVVSSLNSTGGGGGGDEFFSSAAYDNDNPTRYVGRNTLDRKHQVSFGGSFTFKYGPQIGIIGHFFSAQPANLTLDAGLASGNIFQSDITGDGTTGDIAPGTNPGDYMHRVKGDSVAGYISNFNGTYAGRPTPAGQALINSNLFTLGQLQTLKGVIQPIAQVPGGGASNNPAFRSVDINVSYPFRLSKLREGLSLEPSIAFYNVGNFSNFSNFSGVLQNTTTAGGAVNSGAAGQGYITGTNSFPVLASKRLLRGAGTFSQGAPRQAEFGLKLNF